MAKRPTITDLARAAGVSTATVDRVLNDRTVVRTDTARKVYEAARRIGFHAAPLIAQRLNPDVPDVRFGFVLNKEKQAFYQAFITQIEEAVGSAPGIRGRAVIEFATSQSPTEFAQKMLGLQGRVDAVAATAVTHPEVSDAVAALRAGGIPTVALLNDFAQGIRHTYVGLNNLKIGRIAASVLAMAAQPGGKTAVFVGGSRWHGHALRETGFRGFFRETAPAFSVLDTLVNLETRQLTYEATLDLLQRHPDLRGIYCAGGGMEGAIAALREVRAPRAVALIVNELTTDSRAALADGYVTMVMSTPLGQVCRDAVALMTQAVQSGIPELTGQHFLRPELIFPESV